MVEDRWRKKGSKKGNVCLLSLSLPLFPFRLFARAKDGERRKKATAR
jgi:hypothetical protein